MDQLLWVEVYAVFLAVMEELNSGKSLSLFGCLLTHGYWPVARLCAIEHWPPKEMTVWGTALWKLERCVKVGHVDVDQQNSLSGMGGGQNQQVAVLLCSLETATVVHEMSRHGNQQQCKYKLNLDMFFLHPLRHNMPTRTVLSVSKETDWLCGRFPRKKALSLAGKLTDASSLGGLHRSLDRSRHHLWTGLCLPMMHANAESILEGTTKVLHQFGWLSIRNTLYSP